MLSYSSQPGQSIVADGELYYILSKSGFYVCRGSESYFVACRCGGKHPSSFHRKPRRWKKVIYQPNELIFSCKFGRFSYPRNWFDGTSNAMLLSLPVGDKATEIIERRRSFVTDGNKKRMRDEWAGHIAFVRDREQRKIVHLDSQVFTLESDCMDVSFSTDGLLLYILCTNSWKDKHTVTVIDVS